MTVEQLLKPRYKVIADYPSNPRSVGDVFELVHEQSIEVFDNYPHLFKKLKWFEERKPEDMPEYVRYKITGEIANYRDNLKEGRMVVGEYGWAMWACEPATETEYQTYLNGK